ncbi:hypothetical protein QQ008_08240 [Fulvivirgaceae bacterium BMA10]|uniref:Uncharacterized protein n=1 Tax=Splendidivirga corallicola TaxID=3051826 RepID=A0ABT8KMT5_9BACT|nr:hypothetical protein [Fulvivirgaceae bacterium BMA10]
MEKEEKLFKHHLIRNYKSYLKENKIAHSPSNLIDYLLKHNIIDITTVRRYAILHEFHILYPKNSYHKTNTVIDLAIEFDVHENSIWTILKDHARRFDPD